MATLLVAVLAMSATANAHPMNVGRCSDSAEPVAAGLDPFSPETGITGISSPPCQHNAVVVNIRTDNKGTETSWAITPVGSTVAVCSGSGYSSNAAIQVDCCLLDGCYILSVFDLFGDGLSISSPAGMGGYRLYNGNGQRIIDNWRDGNDFDSPAGGYTSSVADGFCVPIGATQVTIATCDRDYWAINDVIVSGTDPLVTADYPDPTSGYQFWFFNPDGGYSRRIFRAHGANTCIASPTGATLAAHLRLSCLNSVLPNLPCDTLLNVSVRPCLNGVYGAFGPACRFKMPCVPVTCPTTKLDDNLQHAGSTLSCGATGKVVGATGNTGKIWPNVVPGANRYQYLFRYQAENYLRLITAPVGQYSLVLANWGTNPLICGTLTYKVVVHASFDGGATYCAYGDTCLVTISNNNPDPSPFCTSTFSGPGGISSAISHNANMNLWPNPVLTGSVTLELEGLGAAATTATVDVYDVFGKRVMTNTLATDGAEELTTVLDTREMATGMYTVNVTSGTRTFTGRLVVE